MRQSTPRLKSPAGNSQGTMVSSRVCELCSLVLLMPKPYQRWTISHVACAKLILHQKSGDSAHGLISMFSVSSS